MERWVAIRRAVHILIAITPVYYLLPEELPVADSPRTMVLLVGALIVSALEIARLTLRFRLPGLRPYEERWIASYAWAAAGVLLALWLLPEDIASASIVSMAVADPLIGELRGRGFGVWHTLVLPIAAGLLLCAIVYFLFDSRSSLEILVLSAVGAVAAVAVERKKCRLLDDDFLMIVVPGAIVAALAWAFWS